MPWWFVKEKDITQLSRGVVLKIYVLPNCTCFFMCSKKERRSMHMWSRREKVCIVAQVCTNIQLSEISSFFNNLFRPPLFLLFFSRRVAERRDRSPPRRLGPPSVSLMDVSCVWEEAAAWACFMLVLSRMSSEAAGDETSFTIPTFF